MLAYTDLAGLRRSCLLLTVVCVLLQWLQSSFLYDADQLWQQPWRLWTAHWVHVSWPHAALNLTALLLLPWIFPHYPPRRFWLMLGLGCPLISICMWFGLPDLRWYAGLSGILHGIYFSAAVHAFVSRTDRLVASILWIGLTVKIFLENIIVGQSTAELIGAPVLTQAHYFGVAVVVFASAILGHFSANSPPKTPVMHK